MIASSAPVGHMESTLTVQEMDDSSGLPSRRRLHPRAFRRDPFSVGRTSPCARGARKTRVAGGLCLSYLDRPEQQSRSRGTRAVSDKKTMKALLLRKHGGLEDLDVVSVYPAPAPVEGHVVIRVRASSFNYHDVFTVRGMPGIKVPLPVIIGLDMAGEIAEVGPGVAGRKGGDHGLVNPANRKKGLMGEMLDGGMAEYCLVAVDQLVAIPAGVTFEEAASLPVAYGTAHRMLVTHETVKKGDRVLVLGASGGVGSGCVILAKLLGAEVIACASSEKKVRRLE